MIKKEQFLLLVTQNFKFLEDKFGFETPLADSTDRLYFVDYKKAEILVRILYSIMNDYIEVAIYNHISKVPPGKYDWKYSVTLMHLLHRNQPGFNYESIMPKNIPMEESLSKLAQLFKEHTSSILMGKEWVSWGEITGFTQHVPSDLP
jgi:hypothetical protein